jgi:hypothetical protein
MFGFAAKLYQLFIILCDGVASKIAVQVVPRL